MALINTDPSLPSNPSPIFSDVDAVRGDQMRANNNLIWVNEQGLDTRLERQESLVSTAIGGSSLTLTARSASKQLLTGTGASTIILPDVTTLYLGFHFQLVNGTDSNITINSSGGNLVKTLLPGKSITIICIAITGTTASSWTVVDVDAVTLNGQLAAYYARSSYFDGSGNANNALELGGQLPAYYATQADRNTLFSYFTAGAANNALDNNTGYIASGDALTQVYNSSVCNGQWLINPACTNIPAAGFWKFIKTGWGDTNNNFAMRIVAKLLNSSLDHTEYEAIYALSGWTGWVWVKTRNADSSVPNATNATNANNLTTITSPSRALGTTYTNPGVRPLICDVTLTVAIGSGVKTMSVIINGVEIIAQSITRDASSVVGLSFHFHVPASATYLINPLTDVTLYNWKEQY